MGSITTRLERLEQRHAPVIHRPAGETFEEFTVRFWSALDGVADDRLSIVMAPWLAAMRHEELRALADELQAVNDGKAGCSADPSRRAG